MRLRTDLAANHTYSHAGNKLKGAHGGAGRKRAILVIDSGYRYTWLIWSAAFLVPWALRRTRTLNPSTP